jgi:predicted nuclease with TOPRIM domain
LLAENNHNAYERLTAETNSSRCAECAADHRQLAEWLTELKDLREENKVLMQECDRLIKEKGELNELKEKAMSDIYRREARLREAKRLLKEAVPIINNTFPEVGSCWGCANHDKVNDECKDGAFVECSEVCKWEHADEALALIGEEGERNG